MLGRLSRRSLMALAAVAILIAAVAVSPSIGGPSFLTLKKAKKKFFTKSAATSLFAAKADVYTKGEVYNRTEADGKFLPSSGQIRWSVPWASWVNETSSPANVPDYFGNLVQFTGGNNSFFSAPVQLPVALLGRSPTLTALELCYAVTPAGVLDLVNVARSTATAASSTPGTSLVISNDTDRTDSNCRTYTPASPVALGPNDAIQVQLRLDLTGGSVDVSRATVIVSI